MATIKIATIINHVRVDEQYFIDAAAAGDVIEIDVIGDYNATQATIDYNSLTTAQQQTMRDAIDISTFQTEDPAFVFKLGLSGNTHTMQSYERLTEASNGDPVAATVKLIAVFSIGWLGATNGVLELPLELATGTAFKPAETDALASKGITVTGDSDSFTITTTTPYRLQCVPPPGTTDNYIVEHDYDIQLIRS